MLQNIHIYTYTECRKISYLVQRFKTSTSLLQFVIRKVFLSKWNDLTRKEYEKTVQAVYFEITTKLERYFKFHFVQ